MASNVVKWFCKKPVIIEAAQWFKNGDHPEDGPDEKEGLIVHNYFSLIRYMNDKCVACGKPLHMHGAIDTLEGEHIVCPGDWIIKGIKGEYYPCKPDIFAATYEEVR